jgi:hypothetical protein
MRRTVEERFWEKVDRDGPFPSDPSLGRCWIWIATPTQHGYGRFNIEGRRFLAHRLAFQLIKKETIEGLELDHICHRRSCVNPEHLRIATHADNAHNAEIRRDNSSGFKCVTWDITKNKWFAKIVHHGKQIYLGRFNNPEDAHRAYCEAARKLYGKFANSGKGNI